MTLVLELPESKEETLKAKALAQGMSAEQYAEKVLYRDLDEVIKDEVIHREAPADSDGRPIWEIIIDMAKDVPREDFATLPRDGASQVDHYIYGVPKRY